MFKDNGRTTPADNSELADLKGKHMKCSVCGEYAILQDVEFANTRCTNCGADMVDVEFENAGKASGK